MRVMTLVLWIAAGTGAAGGAARADSVTEVGDAGQTLATAQPTGAGGPVTDIRTTLATFGDVDLFRIRIADTAAFAAATHSTTDPMLHLFDAAGVRVGFNDDADGGRQARLGGFAGPAGTYYLGVSRFYTGRDVADPVKGTYTPNDGDVSLGAIVDVTLVGAAGAGTDPSAVPLPGAAVGGGALLGLLCGRRLLARLHRVIG